MVSAPNKGHSIKNITEVRDTLDAAEKSALKKCKNMNLTGSELKEYVKKELYKKLKKLGEIAAHR